MSIKILKPRDLSRDITRSNLVEIRAAFPFKSHFEKELFVFRSTFGAHECNSLFSLFLRLSVMFSNIIATLENSGHITYGEWENIVAHRSRFILKLYLKPRARPLFGISFNLLPYLHKQKFIAEAYNGFPRVQTLAECIWDARAGSVHKHVPRKGPRERARG